ncbi:MAG: methylated-DNA--[protein]-cysteine S-methyltransferase [Thermoanaerobaculia bacterium]
MTLFFSYAATPIGRLLLTGDGTALRSIHFAVDGQAVDPPDAAAYDDSPFADVKRELHAYFAGELREFTVPLAPVGTQFQRDVWDMLLTIPYGETSTYGILAARLGNPAASRAVGAANGANPIPIIIPCHRVIGSDGNMTGFGGGIETKHFLLDLEARVCGRPLPPRQGSLFR